MTQHSDAVVPRMAAEMEPIERRFAEAWHDLNCGTDHPITDHEPFDEDEGVISWAEFAGALRRHGLILAEAAASSERSDPTLLREALERLVEEPTAWSSCHYCIGAGQPGFTHEDGCPIVQARQPDHAEHEGSEEGRDLRLAQVVPVAAVPEATLDAKRAVVNALRAAHEQPNAGNDDVVVEDFDWYQERLAAVGFRLTARAATAEGEPDA